MSNEETSQEDEDRMNDMTGDSQSLDAFNIETKPRSVIEGMANYVVSMFTLLVYPLVSQRTVGILLI